MMLQNHYILSNETNEKVEPKFVAGDCQVVDVLGEVEGGSRRVGLVVERPVGLGTIVLQPGNLK